MAEKTIRVSVSVSEHTHRALRYYRVEHGLTIREVVEQGIAAFMASKGDQPDQQSEQDEDALQELSL
jgi:hypothetical protein